MIAENRLAGFLRLAEAVRVDRSLLDNHLGTVDRILSEERTEIADLLKKLEGDTAQAELIEILTVKLAAIDHALTAYHDPVKA